MGDMTYPNLRRPDNGEHCFKKGNDGQMLKVTNQHIVPYNEFLLMKYRSHINVEIVSSLGVVKYLFKYIFKGFDRALVERFTDGFYKK